MVEKLNIVNEDNIGIMVRNFYKKIRQDDRISGIFMGVIGSKEEEWEHHFHILSQFWSSIILGTKTYQGNPLMKHLGLPNFNIELFNVWIEIFHQNTNEMYTAEISDIFNRYASGIAKTFRNGFDRFRPNMLEPRLIELPDDLVLIRSTDIFTEDTLPRGLLKDHSTAAGVWGKIIVKTGWIIYHNNNTNNLLNKYNYGVIQPAVLHHLQTIGPVEFCVEFLKSA